MSFSTVRTLGFVGDFLAARQDGVQQIEVADFNRDGISDFIVTRIVGSDGDSPTNFRFMIGQGDGRWSDQTEQLFNGLVPSVTYAPVIKLADFNNDGVSDVYIPDFGYHGGSGTGGTDQVWLSSPNGTFVATAVDATQRKVHGVSVGDLTGDGITDIVLNDIDLRYNAGTRLYVNDGSGLLSNQQDFLPDNLQFDNPNRLTHMSSHMVDLNNDGRLDLVLGAHKDTDFSNSGNTPSVVLLNEPGSLFSGSNTITLPQSPTPNQSVIFIESMDFDADGHQDLLLSVTDGTDGAAYYSTGYIQFLRNDQNGNFIDETALRFPTQIPGELNSWSKFLRLADFTGNGALDILVVKAYPPSNSESLEDSAYLLLNNGLGVFDKHVSIPIQVDGFQYSWPNAPTIADVNGDGKPDIVTARYDQNSENFELVALINTFSNAAISAVEDGVYRFLNTSTGAHFYTSSFYEARGVGESMPQMSYEGPVYRFQDSADDTTPFYRFYNTQAGTHFYTSNEDEKNIVQATLPYFTFEGVAYAIETAKTADNVALHRFNNTNAGTHFYTASEEERGIVVGLSGFIYEGVVGYVDPI